LDWRGDGGDFPAHIHHNRANRICAFFPHHTRQLIQPLRLCRNMRMANYEHITFCLRRAEMAGRRETDALCADQSRV